jgi:hypothetical protein
MYLYRAVDSDGNTIEFMLSPTRDARAARTERKTGTPRLPPPWYQARDWVRVAGSLRLPIGNVEMSVVDEAAQPESLVPTEAVGQREGRSEALAGRIASSSEMELVVRPVGERACPLLRSTARKPGGDDDRVGKPHY